jgi:hypothetical protein
MSYKREKNLPIGAIKNAMSIFNVLLYTSILMVAGSVWVDCGGLKKIRDGSQQASVLLFIELEFLIFMTNAFGIAVFLFLKYYLTWSNGVGLKIKRKDEDKDDLMEEDVISSSLFQQFFCNMVVGIYLVRHPQFPTLGKTNDTIHIANLHLVSVEISTMSLCNGILVITVC